MKGFKKCKNGHYYKEELASCPYCPTGHTINEPDGPPTKDMAGGQDFDERTQVYGGDKTTDRGTKPVSNGGSKKYQGPTNGTLIIDETEEETENGGVKIDPNLRSSRRLVGWLVSYTIDRMGVDFKLYEGRNSIGTDDDCQITLPDRTVSGRHALLLFRSNKYSITDQQSTHGTFVNDEDIELEPRYLKDGDIIRLGQTAFKFRSSL